MRLFHLSKIFPNLESAQQVLASVANGTINIMSVFIAYLVAQLLAKHFDADATLVGLTSVAAFMILYPTSFSVDGVNAISTQYLGAQGLFVAMIVACLVGEFLPKLFKVKRLQIKMPDMVPPAVSRSFSGMIPIVIIVAVTALINFLVLMIAPEGINELIYKGIQSPLRDLGGNVVGVLILAFLQTLLFSIGIHGPNTLNAVRSAIFTEQDLANLDFINQGGSLWDVPYKETWGVLNDMFANMGGTGMTLGLIIAIFIASKRPEQREIAKMSLVPGIFQINEPIIFGLPNRLESDYDHSLYIDSNGQYSSWLFCNSHLADHADTSNRCALDHTGNHQLVPRNWRKCSSCNRWCGLSGDFRIDLLAIRDCFKPFTKNRSVTFLGGKNYEQQNAKRFSMGWRNCCPSSRKGLGMSQDAA